MVGLIDFCTSRASGCTACVAAVPGLLKREKGLQFVRETFSSVACAAVPAQQPVPVEMAPVTSAPVS